MQEQRIRRLCRDSGLDDAMGGPAEGFASDGDQRRVSQQILRMKSNPCLPNACTIKFCKDIVLAGKKVRFSSRRTKASGAGGGKGSEATPAPAAKGGKESVQALKAGVNMFDGMDSASLHFEEEAAGAFLVDQLLKLPEEHLSALLL